MNNWTALVIGLVIGAGLGWFRGKNQGAGPSLNLNFGKRRIA